MLLQKFGFSIFVIGDKFCCCSSYRERLDFRCVCRWTLRNIRLQPHWYILMLHVLRLPFLHLWALLWEKILKLVIQNSCVVFSWFTVASSTNEKEIVPSIHELAAHQTKISNVSFNAEYFVYIRTWQEQHLADNGSIFPRFVHRAEYQALLYPNVPHRMQN